jgi:hypothetical protein
MFRFHFQKPHNQFDEAFVSSKISATLYTLPDGPFLIIKTAAVLYLYLEVGHVLKQLDHDGTNSLICESSKMRLQ